MTTSDTPASPAPGTKVVVAGATGYIGGRLIPRLLDAGCEVTAIVRSPDKLQSVPWRDRVRIVEGSLDDAEAVEHASRGSSIFYYLVHSMSGSKDFYESEQQMARAVAAGAERAGIKRIVYLGGLHPEGVELSQHMASRTAVGDVFLKSSVPAIVFEAGVIIGSGSASFEMMRHLAEVLPVMPAPSWVKRRIDPISVRDVLYYLVGALGLPAGLNRRFEIGSRDVMTYGDMMKECADVLGLPHRYVYALPHPAPRLAGYWVALVTPLPLSLTRPLVESLQHDAVADDHDVDDYIPQPADGLTPFRTAVERAIEREKNGDTETSWANAGSFEAAANALPSDPEWAGHTVFTDVRECNTRVDADAIWSVIESIGGENGWYSAPSLWRIRGLMDKLVGGFGIRRGRTKKNTVAVGDPIDWWRVEAVEPGKRLLLRAEMLAPGKAWLELSVEKHPGGSKYRQRAIFFPSGLSGRAYWFGILPFHALIFPTMAKNIIREARRRQSS